MKSKIIFLLIVLLTNNQFNTGAEEAKSMSKLIDEVFTVAKKQYFPLATKVYKQEGRVPRATDAKGNLVTSDISWWTSGFFPGALWYIYEYTKDTTMRGYAQKFTKRIESEKFTTNNHDVGFMLYCSFGNGYRLTQDPTYTEVLVTGSNSLITRYRPEIKSIQSWDKSTAEEYNCPVIIDNMMNLEMLFWASEFTNNPKYREIALHHANSTMKNHFRKDYSSYHVIDYDLTSGKIIKKVTNQGYADESAWARGQAWGLYGYVLCYKATKEMRYLTQAKHIANFVLNNPQMPDDMIPYWDFNAPKIPNEPRDASAAAVIASALIEMSSFVGKQDAEKYKSTAEKILRSLASQKYLAKIGSNQGFLLMHNVGNLPKNYEIDTALCYADYYFLEALLKYKEKFL